MRLPCTSQNFFGSSSVDSMRRPFPCSRGLSRAIGPQHIDLPILVTSCENRKASFRFWREETDPMDRLEAMSILLAAAETGSLSAAGRRLGKPLTTISRKMSELEAHLNVRLLNRTGRKLTLTDAGQSYAQAAKRILEDVREAERSTSGEYAEPKGDLVITTSLILGRQHVLPIIAEFLKVNPGVNVQLLLSNHIANMMEEPVDLAIRIGNRPDSSLIAIHLGSTRRVVCGSPAYFREHGIPKTPAELRAHDCVTIGGFMSPATWT